jgi:hypothetical protein
MNEVARTSKQSNAVQAGNAFVARFNREPANGSDAAWLNGYAAALEANALETSEQQPVAWRCQNSFGEWRFTTVKPDLVRYGFWEPVFIACAQKASESHYCIDHNEAHDPRTCGALHAFACPVTKTPCIRNCSPERCAIAATT